MPKDTAIVNSSSSLDYKILGQGRPHEIYIYVKKYGREAFRAEIEKSNSEGNNGLHIVSRFNKLESILLILYLTGPALERLLAERNLEGKTPSQIFMETDIIRLLAAIPLASKIKEKFPDIKNTSPDFQALELFTEDKNSAEGIAKTSPPQIVAPSDLGVESESKSGSENHWHLADYEKFSYQPKFLKLQKLRDTFMKEQALFMEVTGDSQKKLIELVRLREVAAEANKIQLDTAERRMSEIMKQNKDAKGQAYPSGRVVVDIGLFAFSFGSIQPQWKRDYDELVVQKKAAEKNEQNEDINFVVDIIKEEERLRSAQRRWTAALNCYYPEALRTKHALDSSAYDRGFNGVLSALSLQVNLNGLADSFAKETQIAYKQFYGDLQIKQILRKYPPNKPRECLATVASVPGKMIQATTFVGGLFKQVKPAEGDEVGYSASWNPH